MLQMIFGVFEEEVRTVLAKNWAMVVNPANEPAASLPTEQDKRKFFDAMTDTLLPGVKTTSKPSLIVIEDLHWADEATLAFLVYLVRRIQARPTLLAMTYRNDEVGAALEKFLAGLDRDRLADEIELKRLTNHETAALIRATFDLERPPQTEFRDGRQRGYRSDQTGS